MVKFNNCIAQHDEVRQGYKRFAKYSSTIHLDFENKSYNNDEIPSIFLYIYKFTFRIEIQ